MATTLSITAASASPTLLMPDLGMARFRQFSVDTTLISGRSLLRFTTVLINIGDGPLQTHGYNLQPNGDMSVEQQIQDSLGGWTSYPTEYHMYYAGDLHSHWHLRDFESYVLQRNNGPDVRTGAKHGFCLQDSYTFNLSLPGAPSSAHYLNCGNSSSTEVTTGISVGWGDKYAYKLRDQYIDITDLPSGQYTLTGTADALNSIAERCELNNTTKAVLQISGNSVTIVNQGGPSKRC
ncbi:MAG: hypothetical protein H0W81_02260 [Chloroflexi bacterium]|nr:hypothetical protein [Chloroflexota bacterium]